MRQMNIVLEISSAFLLIFQFFPLYHDLNSPLDGSAMHIGQEQYIFSDGIKPYDPNLNLIDEYIPPPENNTNSHQSTTIEPIHAIASNFNDDANQNPEIFFISSSNVSNNCIAYSNMTLMPSNQLDQIADAIGLVKNGAPGIEPNDTYILSSDSRFANAFQTSDIDNASTANVLCNDSQANAYIEQSPHMITAVSQINDGNLVVNEIPNENGVIHQNVNAIEQNQISIQMHPGPEQEVFLQDQNGQLYRHVQNIYGSSELVPVIATPSGEIAEAVYNVDNFHRIPHSYQPNKETNHHELSYQLPVSYVETPVSTANMANTSKSTDDNLDMQQVEFIFNSYKNSKSLNENIQATNLADSNQYGVAPVPNMLDDKQNYQSRHEMQSDKDQQRMFDCCESTMSTLCKYI